MTKKLNKKHRKRKITHNFGFYAEHFAMVYLWLKGYWILRHRYKYNGGDIDIIAKKNNYLVFIEVKSSHFRMNSEKVLSDLQIDKIQDGAQFFLERNQKLSNLKCRYDFIEVTTFLKIFLRIKHNVNFIS